MILNRQTKVRIAVAPLERFLREIRSVAKIADTEVSIAFVTDAEIAKWNESYRRRKGPTDVLSFPAFSRRNAGRNTSAKRRKTQPADDRFLGDIAIAPETARRYAKKHGRTLASELRILMLHGVLHLMGYDHESDNGQMNRIEQKLRRRLGIQ